MSLSGIDAPALQSRYELDVYGKRGITIVKGRGARLWDDSGREYIDCVSGHGAFNLGHAHPLLLRALVRQAQELAFSTGAFHHPEKARLMERLVRAAPAGRAGLARVFLCNSGTEAVEAALKFARATTGRREIVSFKRSFHGRTLGALSASFQPRYHEMFAPMVPGTRFLSYNDTSGLDAALTGDVACAILELVQGEGGVYVADPPFVAALAQLCADRGILLAVDEVQTGFGRTGPLLACERYGLAPDLLCLAKSIAGGFPMGAVLASERVRVPVGAHGSTLGGNPVACAVANAVLDCFEDGELLREASRKGDRFQELLRAIRSDAVEEVRGAGMLIGIQLRSRVAPVLDGLAERGILALAAGPKVLRLLPPLVIEERDLEAVAETLNEVLGEGLASSRLLG